VCTNLGAERSTAQISRCRGIDQTRIDVEALDGIIACVDNSKFVRFVRRHVNFVSEFDGSTVSGAARDLAKGLARHIGEGRQEHYAQHSAGVRGEGEGKGIL
jgi:hypothetical protein